MLVTYEYEDNKTTAKPAWVYEDKSPTAKPSIQVSSEGWYMTPNYQQGWICPRCGRVNAPWVMTCPCKSNAYIFKEEKPITYTTTTTSSVPASCKECSKHPSNGGDGICHCTLGTQTIN